MATHATEVRVWPAERKRHHAAAHDSHDRGGEGHASSRQRTFAHERANALPAGCARGGLVVTGVPSAALPGGTELFDVLMSFVERDDYHAVLEVARRGGNEIDFNVPVGFTVNLHKEAGRIAATVPDKLYVCEANLLHYAISTSCLRAAIALLVVCPAMLHAKCKVVATNPATQKKVEEFWRASDIARIFCLLYDEQDDADTPAQAAAVSAQGAKYNQALLLLEIGQRSPANLPFLTLPRKAQRIAAAGCDAEAAVGIFESAARDYCQRYPRFQQRCAVSMSR